MTKNFLCLLLLVCLVACAKHEPRVVQSAVSNGLSVLHERGTLRVALRQDEGYDYELAADAAQYMGVELQVVIVDGEREAREALDGGKVDVVAFACARGDKMRDVYELLPTRRSAPQVLVQRMGVDAVRSLPDLRGCQVVVPETTSAHQRLLAMVREVGGDDGMVRVVSDTVRVEELIEQVARGEIDFTIASREVALLYGRRYPHLDVRTEVSMPRRMGWLVSKATPVLAEAMQAWASNYSAEERDELYRMYFTENRQFVPQTSVDSVSPYDEYFKQYAPEVGWDWRLLAALGYHESRFTNEANSHRGAMGVMQLMPQTAAAFGVDSVMAYVPELNIAASVQYIKQLQRIYRRVDDANERVYFVLASYNAGPAHVIDAMELARKYGRDPYLWSGNVEYFLKRKNEEEIYSDEAVQFGRFNSEEPVAYVRKIMKTYERYLQ